ncbi:MAG: HAMP domain-containing histidine kinase [Chloroflexi bacterium]|nr:HAMP domain-containing histidine kinase [Chloroflexota bacterium]
MSVRLRLALWSAGLVGLALLVAGLLAYAIHGRNLYADQDVMLRTGAEHAAQEYTANRNITRLIPTSPDVTIRVYDSAGHVIDSTPNAPTAPAVDPRGLESRPSTPPYDPILGLVPPFAAVDTGQGTFGLATASDGTRWRLYLLPLDGQPARYLLAAAPLNAIDSFIQRFRQLVGLLALAGAAITVFASWTIVDRALRPVATLTETAADIAGSGKFDRRVPVGSRRDELEHLAATFNGMLNRLEKAYKSQQRFVGDASHELRAPLTAIQANLELLRTHPRMPEAERTEAVEEASREADRLTRLVADLLALARADAGVPLSRQEVELDRVLLNAVNEARHLARGQKVEIDHLEPAMVRGDPDRLKQLLLILLDNAFKYTPRSGSVKVALSRGARMAELTVQDTGVGIPPEDLPNVFERFYRADPARSRDPGGTGLGLSIARWIARQHGGDITLASELERGTTVTVHLPIG